MNSEQKKNAPAGVVRGFVIRGEPVVEWDRSNLPAIGDSLYTVAQNSRPDVSVAIDKARQAARIWSNAEYMCARFIGQGGVGTHDQCDQAERECMAAIKELGELATPSAPVGVVPSIDTPALGQLLADYARACENSEPQSVYVPIRAALIAHIDQHVASQVREAQAGQVAVPEAPALDDQLADATNALRQIAGNGGEAGKTARAALHVIAAIHRRAAAPSPASESLRSPQEAAGTEKGALTRCAAGRDGECGSKQCPQLRDNEPRASGRHCPLDNEGPAA